MIASGHAGAIHKHRTEITKKPSCAGGKFAPVQPKTHGSAIQAHILFSFLAYAMWKMLELWMSRCGLGNGPRPLIEEFERIKANDVVLPTSN